MTDTDDRSGNYPGIPDSSTCKHSLQVATDGAVQPLDKPVRDLEVGMTVHAYYGVGVITDIEVGEWRYSRKPRHRVVYRRFSDGETKADLCFPETSLIHNKESHYGTAPACGPTPNPWNPCPICHSETVPA